MLRQSSRSQWQLTAASLIAVLMVVTQSGCTTAFLGQSPEQLPRYGEPGDTPSMKLFEINHQFLESAVARFDGDRHRASNIWSMAANEFVAQGQLRYALRGFNQSWLLDSSNYMPYWGFARIMLQRNNVDAAIGYFEKALALCDDEFQMAALLTDTASVYSRTAIALGNVSDAEIETETTRMFDKAHALFERASQMDPNYINAWIRWSISLQEAGKHEAARVTIQRARALAATQSRNRQIENWSIQL